MPIPSLWNIAWSPFSSPFRLRRSNAYIPWVSQEPLPFPPPPNHRSEVSFEEQRLWIFVLSRVVLFPKTHPVKPRSTRLQDQWIHFFRYEGIRARNYRRPFCRKLTCHLLSGNSPTKDRTGPSKFSPKGSTTSSSAGKFPPSGNEQWWWCRTSWRCREIHQ